MEAGADLDSLQITHDHLVCGFWVLPEGKQLLGATAYFRSMGAGPGVKELV